MSGKSSKTKGRCGEYEARDLIAEWLKPVYEHCGEVCPELRRNLTQTRGGGFDIEGVDWLALEVKRQEQVSLGSWWGQTVRQAGDGQVPVLMWRQNRRPWAFRIKLLAANGAAIVANLDLEAARDWLQHEAWVRLQKPVDTG